MKSMCKIANFCDVNFSNAFPIFFLLFYTPPTYVYSYFRVTIRTFVGISLTFRFAENVCDCKAPNCVTFVRWRQVCAVFCGYLIQLYCNTCIHVIKKLQVCCLENMTSNTCTCQWRHTFKHHHQNSKISHATCMKYVKFEVKWATLLLKETPAKHKLEQRKVFF